MCILPMVDDVVSYMHAVTLTSTWSFYFALFLVLDHCVSLRVNESKTACYMCVTSN